MNRRTVYELMHCIEPQAVDMIVAHPHNDVVAEEAPHLVAACTFEVDRAAPGCMMPVRHIRPELARIVSHRPEVVVDHIQDHTQTALMADVNQTLQPVRSAICILHC